MASPELSFIRNERDPVLDELRARKARESAAASEQEWQNQQVDQQAALQAASAQARRQELLAAGARPEELPSGPPAPPSGTAHILQDPRYQAFVLEQKKRAAEAAAVPPTPTAPVAIQAPAPVAPAVPERAPIRMFTSPALDVSAGPTPDVPTYTNVGTRGEVVDLGGPSRGTVSSPGGSDDVAYQRYRRNMLGDSEYSAEQAGIAESAAKAARAKALTANPFAAEDRAQERAYQLEATRAKFGMERDAAKDAAKFAPYDAAVDGMGPGDIPPDDENAAHIKQLMSVKDGTITPAGPMTPELRTHLVGQVLERFKRQQKLRIRQLGTTRAPGISEQSFGVAPAPGV